MSRSMNPILGPHISLEEMQAHKWRYRLPGTFLMIARVLLLSSIFVPFWHMELEAPQYPEGLQVTAYVNHLTGDVAEIDSLNHYIGMRPLEEAAVLERTAAVWMIIAMVLLVESAARIRTKWAALLLLPAIFFPVVFLVDLHLWLDHFGQNLDETAPLSSSIKPFTPPVLGVGIVGQFRTVATAGIGWWLAVTAGVLMIVALFFHRRAYKPLHDKAKAAAA